MSSSSRLLTGIAAHPRRAKVAARAAGTAHARAASRSVASAFAGLRAAGGTVVPSRRRSGAAPRLFAVLSRFGAATATRRSGFALPTFVVTAFAGLALGPSAFRLLVSVALFRGDADGAAREHGREGQGEFLFHDVFPFTEVCNRHVRGKTRRVSGKFVPSL